ncbi:ankyrin repeat protein, putative [Trichomonas vaginalis G3]|uniref:Ankyrin repeat protein, putative n=1 Tax=Trichomonas vaginalis (strain ATCC PRA-98 / G3) TaxID=412133 RepID=A2F5S8_TRIV3|nr:protein ubiquitination [Trichomonas vaginalis G3]EAX99713.1 ankyrin repeat protein, putative [Trichomonas vaginalis G3]KAI5501430.1 protein ubiquitination [Trichomonas vaginalis G3]|eukprot:XP_001312643.1 ankyrin repeat protein [Trichomonas vaginalis G3]
MSDQIAPLNKYIELRSNYKNYIDSYNALYQLKAQNEEEIKEIYEMIKRELIDSNKHIPQNIINDILSIIPYNNRYTKSYLKLIKLISDDYYGKDVKSIPLTSSFYFYNKKGNDLDRSIDFPVINYEYQEILTKNTIYRAIMYDDKESFIFFTEREGFDENKKLKSKLYPFIFEEFSLLEICCYYGAVNCFKLLRTNFNSEITEFCLKFSFLRGNKEIISECLKYQKPVQHSMLFAIISHNIDFVTFLMNEYKFQIDLFQCGYFKNLEAFLVYFDQTNDINKCFIRSAMFDIPSLCDYFLSLGTNINARNSDGETALYFAVSYNCGATTEFLLSHGADINKMPNNEETALFIAAKNCKNSAEVLLSHGANIDETNEKGMTAFCIAVYKNNKEMVDLLLSYGANPNERNNNGEIALTLAAKNNNKEMVELLLSHGANINEKNYDERTALHIAAYHDNIEMVELLLSHGVNINEEDKNAETAYEIAANCYYKEIAELLLTHEVSA